MHISLMMKNYLFLIGSTIINYNYEANEAMNYNYELYNYNIIIINYNNNYINICK